MTVNVGLKITSVSHRYISILLTFTSFIDPLCRMKHRVSRRKDGRYVQVIDVGMIDGKRIRKYLYGATAGEVTAQVIAARSDLSKGMPIATTALTVAEFSKTWLETSLKLTAKPRGYESFDNAMRKHVIPAIGGIKLIELSPGHLQKLIADKIAAGYHALTVRYLVSVIRSMLTKAVKLGLLSRNVATSMYLDLPRIQRREVMVLNPEQARTFLNVAAGQRYECIFTMAIALGMRRGELVGLRWSDLDLDAGILKISQTLQRLRTGSDEYHRKTAMTPTDCKTPKSRRSIALPAFVVKSLRAQRAKQAEQRLRAVRWWDQTDLVFTGKFGKPVEEQALHTDYKKLLEKAGLPTSMRFHDLRHCAASLLLAKGVHPRMVMELLGHSNIAITMNIYSHVLESSKRDVADAMALVLGR